MKTARSTQVLVNAFPPWSNARIDQQSNLYQFLNYTVGIPLDELRETINKIRDNYYLSTADVSDPDVFYTIKLPDSLVLTKDDDNTESNFELPTMSGYDNGLAYAITIAEDNSINDFWFDAIPDRITLDTTTSGVYPILASGLVQDYESMVLPSGIDLPNTFFVTVSGANSCLEVIDNLAYIGTVQLEGTTRQDQENVIESFTFIHDGTQKTIRDFKELISLKVYNINYPDETIIQIRSHNFNNGPYQTQDVLDHSLSNNLLDTFWNIAQGTNTSHLEYLKYQMEMIEDRISGYLDTDKMYVFELYDTASNAISIVDMAIEYFSNKLWLTSSSKLYCFDNELPGINCSKMTKKQTEAAILLEPQTIYGSNYYSILGQLVTINYIYIRPTKSIIKHRVFIEDPSGNKYTINTNFNGTAPSGTFFVDDTSWIYGDPINRVLRTPDIFLLDQLGEYVFTLEAQYSDLTTETTQCIVSNIYKQPLAEFDLNSIGINNIVGIDIDSENNILLLSNNNTVYQIKLHYDIALLNPITKIVYLREDYDQVKVI